LPSVYSAPRAVPWTGAIRNRTGLPLAPATRSSPFSSISSSMLLASSSGRPRATDQSPRRRLRAPRGEPDGDPQRLAPAAGFDLDRAEPVEDPARDHLPARPVGARQDDQQLPVARHPDPVEAAQLAAQGARDVGHRLLAQLAAVLAGHLFEVVDDDQQAAELGPVALGAADLLAEALVELDGARPVERARRSRGEALGRVAGSHALKPCPRCQGRRCPFRPPAQGLCTRPPPKARAPAAPGGTAARERSVGGPC